MAYSERFKLRRQMAVSSMLIGLIGFPIACCFKPELTSISVPYYLFIGAQITHYQHLVTKEDTNDNKDKDNN